MANWTCWSMSTILLLYKIIILWTKRTKNAALGYTWTNVFKGRWCLTYQNELALSVLFLFNKSTNVVFFQCSFLSPEKKVRVERGCHLSGSKKKGNIMGRCQKVSWRMSRALTGVSPFIARELTQNRRRGLDQDLRVLVVAAWQRERDFKKSIGFAPALLLTKTTKKSFFLSFLFLCIRYYSVDSCSRRDTPTTPRYAKIFY